MYKKLDDEKLNSILESGIEEFALNGFDKANTNIIAKKSGVSVGALFKYFGDKDSFFLACVRYALNELNHVVEELQVEELPLEQRLEMLIRTLVSHAKIHPYHNRMYNEITSAGCGRFSAMLASEIEEISAKAYIKLIENARNDGLIVKTADPRFFAFFFDNLLMMIQFSFCCDYYKERMRIFLSDESVFSEDSEERLIRQLTMFINGAFCGSISEKGVEQ